MTRALNLGPLLFQATIDLTIGYDPPANAAPNLNDPDAGDTAADAGTYFFNLFYQSFDVMWLELSLQPVTCVVCLLLVSRWRGG